MACRAKGLKNKKDRYDVRVPRVFSLPTHPENRGIATSSSAVLGLNHKRLLVCDRGRVLELNAPTRWEGMSVSKDGGRGGR